MKLPLEHRIALWLWYVVAAVISTLVIVLVNDVLQLGAPLWLLVVWGVAASILSAIYVPDFINAVKGSK